MDGKKILTVQHGEEIGPGGVLRLFGVVKEDVDTLMVLLDQHSQYEKSCFVFLLNDPILGEKRRAELS